MRRRPDLRSQEGQSTIEFALTLILLMGFVLFYLQLSLVMAFGNYVHYATFMSARAYLSGGENQAEQARRARQVIVRMLKLPGSEATDRFPAIAKGDGGEDNLFGGNGQIKGLSLDRPRKIGKGRGS